MIKQLINKDILHFHKYNPHKQITTEQKFKIQYETNLIPLRNFTSPKYIFDFFDSSKDSCSIIKQDHEMKNNECNTINTFNQDNNFAELNSLLIKDFLKDDSIINESIETIPYQLLYENDNNIIISNNQLMNTQCIKPIPIHKKSKRSTQSVKNVFKSRTNQSSPRFNQKQIKSIINDFKDKKSTLNLIKRIESPFDTKTLIKKRIAYNKYNKHKGMAYNFKSANISKDDMKKSIFEEILSTLTHIKKEKDILKPSKSLGIISCKSQTNKVLTSPKNTTISTSIGKSTIAPLYKRNVTVKISQNVHKDIIDSKSLIKKNYIYNKNSRQLKKEKVPNRTSDIPNENDSDKFFNNQIQKKRNKTFGLTARQNQSKSKIYANTKYYNGNLKLKGFTTINDAYYSPKNLSSTNRSDRLLCCYFSYWK